MKTGAGSILLINESPEYSTVPGTHDALKCLLKNKFHIGGPLNGFILVGENAKNSIGYRMTNCFP